MRLYVKKLSNNEFQIYKETLSESVISNFTTMLVIILLIGLDALFSIYIGRSFMIDLMMAVTFFLYIFGILASKKVEVTEDELIKIIKN